MQTKLYPVDNLPLVRRGRRAQRGQTIVIALLVLLLIGFIGGVFVAIVTRSLQAVNRTNRVQSADFYAEAGVRFADQQLTTSLDGADWRPPLQAALLNPPAGTTLEGKRYANAGLTPASANDPDKAYLDQGFTRYNIGGGRYLLRVTYDPLGLANSNNTTQGSPYSDPLTRYIKIESIGREGVVDSQDPTTYRNAPVTRLNATLVQYKAIGITDYTRFETNPDNRSDVMALGVASMNDSSGNVVTPGTFDFKSGSNPPTLAQYPVITTYGATDAYIKDANGFLSPNPSAGAGGTPPSGAVPGGGIVKANGSVRLFGLNQAYLSTTVTVPAAAGAGSGNTTYGFDEGWQIAGNLLLDDYLPATGDQATLRTNQKAALVLQSLDPATGAGLVTNYAFPTNDRDPATNQSRFSTYLGQVRDGSNGTDDKGQPRNVSRLDPPTLDAVNPVTSLPRYRDMAVNSAPRPYAGSPVTAASPAAHGYGQSIYVDNKTDVQRESSRLVGGYTLIDEWLHRSSAAEPSGAKSGWVANFYRPPGADIVLGRQIRAVPGNAATPSQSFYGLRVTRSDVDGAGSPIPWKYPTNVRNDANYVDDNWDTHEDLGSTLAISYDELNAGHPLDPTTLTTAQRDAYNANPNNDVTVYLEGNVRLRGVVSVDPTVAALNGYPQTDAGADDDALPRHITIVTNGTAYIDGSLMRGNPESTITVMAHDYVCVNTTQFLAGTIADQNPLGTTAPGAFVGDPTLRALDFTASDEVLLQEFRFGLPQGRTLAGSGAASPPFYGNTPLALYVSGGPSAPGGTSADFDILNLQTGLTINNNQLFQTPPLADQVTSTGSGSDLARTTFPLIGSSLLTATADRTFGLAVRRSQGADLSGNPTADNGQDFLLERAAILPMDVRIEAVLFAQTKSFFVIPGDWFNTDTSDNLDRFATQNVVRPGLATTDATEPEYVKRSRFPLHGQPIDMKIIINGSVSEARPADIAAQSAWMGKWGWIPRYHGSLLGSAPGATTAEPAGHTPSGANGPAAGLSIIYNPLAGYPYYGGHYMRSDIYGRALPFSPRLPVCAGLLYAGQNTTDQSALQ